MNTHRPRILSTDELEALMTSYRLHDMLNDPSLRALQIGDIEDLHLALPSKTVSFGVLASSRGRLVVVLQCALEADEDLFSISDGAPDQIVLCVPDALRSRPHRSCFISYYLLNRAEQKAHPIGKELQTSDPLILTPPVMGNLVIDIEFD